jgi:acetate---CoA ligase (ADP-forming)
MRPAPEALLAPGSIAIVGASDDPAKTASRPLRYLREAGFTGRIYPIARRPAVLGERAWPSLDALPERPDHAFILLPAEAAMAAVADCVRLGVPVATMLAGGFSEAGPEGAAREARLRASLRGSETRLLGPNSIGLANLTRRMVLTANAAFAEHDLPKGGLFVASQSGSMIGALLSRGKARGIGFAGLVSVGAEADLDIGSICAATIADPDVTAYLLFLETLRATPSLRTFAVAAAAHGKPVVAYKLGRSAQAAELALSHTGALAGEDDVADAFLRDCGIARVGTLEGLLEAPALLHRLPIRPHGARKAAVGVVTTTGGGAAMVVDQLGLRGVCVRPPSPATREHLAASGVEPGHGRILDLTLAGTRPEVMRPALAALLAAPEFDLVIAVTGSSARFQPELAVQPVAEAAKGGAALAAFCVPDAPEALAMLAQAGVPAFRTPETCADAIAAALARHVPRALPAALPTGGKLRRLDETEAYALLAEIGVPHAPCVALPAARAGHEPLPFPFPVAVKILHRDVMHKTDLGGVALGIVSDMQLRDSVARIVALVARHRPDLAAGRVLVQAMASPLGEVLLGYRNDDQVGPIVLLAAGGVMAEIFRDRSVRMAPVDETTAHEMIAEVRALRVLDGFRGRPRGDLAALARAIVAISGLAMRGDVAECEINPLMIMEDGVLAVDAVASLYQREGGG